MLANEAGVKMTPVHYRGGAPALQDLLGGHVPASVNPISEVLTQAKSGALRMLAVTGSQRSRVPARRADHEGAGLQRRDRFLDRRVRPGKTPPETVNALSAAIEAASKSPEMAESLAKFGNDPAFQTPAQFGARVRPTSSAGVAVVKASGFVASGD